MAKHCTICGKPIVLVPSAAERAAKDVTGKPASYYLNLFTEHADCTIAKRTGGDRRLARKAQEFDTSTLALFGDGHRQQDLF